MTSPLWPLAPDLCEITSPFGPRPAPVKGASELHNGVDVRCSFGSLLCAPDDGVVLDVWMHKTGGLSLAVQCGDMRFGFCHLSHCRLGARMRVLRGHPVALSGGLPGSIGAGTSTGPHLHLTTRRMGADGRWIALDPMTLEWVDAAGAPVILKLVKKGAA